MKIILEAISAVFWLVLVILLTMAVLTVALLYSIIRIFRININIPEMEYSKLYLRKGI